MKLTESQIRRIVRKEIVRENKKIIKEYGGMSVEIMSPLIQFAQDFAGLGGAVGEQVITIVNAYIENDQEAVYEINPNALDMAMQRLSRPLNDLGQTNPDAEEVMEALEWAKGIFEQGDAEVEADARAAGDL